MSGELSSAQLLLEDVSLPEGKAALCNTSSIRSMSPAQSRWHLRALGGCPLLGVLHAQGSMQLQRN